MISNYAKYIAEREDFSIVEDEHGFATYKIQGEECYIRDIFVCKSARRTGVGSLYGDQVSAIAKAAGCKFLSGTVYTSAKGADESLTALKAYGFKVVQAIPDCIILKKEL